MAVTAALLGSVVIAACGSDRAGEPPPAAASPPRGAVVIHAAGGDLAAPVYQELGDVYGGRSVRLEYQLADAPRLLAGGQPSAVSLVALDSGAGGDAGPAPSGALYLPVGFDGVSVVYHLPGVPSLRLSAGVLAGIFRGRITRWNAQAIAALNPGARLPARSIIPVHLAGSSQLAELLSAYLSRGVAGWRGSIGADPARRWTVGTGVPAEADMVQIIDRYVDSIGFVSEPVAEQNGLATVALQTRVGRWVSPTIAATTAVGAQSHASARASLSTVDAAGPDAYPVATELYALTWRDPCRAGASAREADALRGLLEYLTGPGGQSLLAGLDFAPLPAGLRAAAQAAAGGLGCADVGSGGG